MQWPVSVERRESRWLLRPSGNRQAVLIKTYWWSPQAIAYERRRPPQSLEPHLTPPPSQPVS